MGFNGTACVPGTLWSANDEAFYSLKVSQKLLPVVMLMKIKLT